MYIVRNGKEKIEEVSLAVKGDLAGSVYGQFDDKGTLNLSGFLSSHDFFYCTWDDKADNLTNVVTTPISGPMFAKYFVEKTEGFTTVGLRISRIICEKDGNVYAFAEYTWSNPGNPNRGIAASYHRNSIFVVAISPTKNILWMCAVAKNQQGPTSDYIGYASQVHNDKVYLIYNDDNKNVNATEFKDLHPYIGVGKGSLTMIATIDQKGRMAKQVLVNNSDEGAPFVPRYSQPVNENLMYLLFDKAKTTKRGWLTFN